MEKHLFSRKRVSAFSYLRSVFTKSLITTLDSEELGPDCRTSVDSSGKRLSYSPLSTRTVADDMHQEQTPQVPPRNRKPQTQENAQQSSQLPATRVTQPSSKLSKYCKVISIYCTSVTHGCLIKWDYCTIQVHSSNEKKTISKPQSEVILQLPWKPTQPDPTWTSIYSKISSKYGRTLNICSFLESQSVLLAKYTITSVLAFGWLSISICN